jgi:DNA invertase Pin-like site-specific DNA recombinase
METSNPKVIGYIRVSTDKQADNGVSLGAQEEDIRNYCKTYHLDLLHIFCDVGSASSMDEREQLQEALQMVEHSDIDGIVVYKLDRLTRSVRDLNVILEDYLTKYSVSLHSYVDRIDTTTESGRLILNILISVSQWERETIRKRVQRGMDRKRELGELVGKAPYGKMVAEDGKTLIDDPYEQTVIVKIKSLRESGKTLQAICDELTSNNIFNRSNKSFAPGSIANILKDNQP